MRLDDAMSAMTIRFATENVSSSLESRGKDALMARSFSLELADEYSESESVAPAASSSGESRSASEGMAVSRHGGILTIPERAGQKVAVGDNETKVPPELSETAPARGVATTEGVSGSGKAAVQASQEIHTPLGIIQLGPEQPRLVVDVGGRSEWEDFFLTHQPADWMRSDAARQEFAKIYGNQALVTLDYDGTVPRNVDPTWVTTRPVDSSGRPLPGSNPLLTGSYVTERA